MNHRRHTHGIAMFDGDRDVDAAIRKLQSAGFDLERLSVKQLLVVRGNNRDVRAAREILAAANEPVHQVDASYSDILHETVPEFVLFVAPPEVKPRRGHELERAVRAALHADPRLADLPISVVVHGSRVALTGSVPGVGTSAYAVDVVKAVAGVAEVDNQLEIADE